MRRSTRCTPSSTRSRRPVVNFTGCAGEEARRRVLELLETVGLTPVEQFAAKLPHQLSGGQRQRVVIARALASDPQVIIADEPVSMLDVSLRAGVLALLEDLREQWGVSMLYITHDLLSARLVTDNILVLNERSRRRARRDRRRCCSTRGRRTRSQLLDAVPNPSRRHRDLRHTSRKEHSCSHSPTAFSGVPRPRPTRSRATTSNSNWWVQEHAPGTHDRRALGRRRRQLPPVPARTCGCSPTLGLNSYRFSIEWARIEPERGFVSRADARPLPPHGRHRHEIGLDPIVTLMHFTVPRWFERDGFWRADDAADLFARYIETALPIVSTA